MPGFDAHNVEDIAHQPQQVFGRMMGQLKGRAVHPSLVGAFDGKLQHADDRVHRGADFMADGRQECALGTVRILGLLLGLTQLQDQLAALADIDPAADDALYLA
ncbi:hypothetical protein D3C81_821700 [compost metagenome]